MTPLILQRADPYILKHTDGFYYFTASWTRSPDPVFQTCYEGKIYGPGHNSFTYAEDGDTVMLVYHARTDTEIVGDPLWNPDRHTFVKPSRRDAAGMSVFGKASHAD